jgi:hypothetical protein
MGDGRTSMMRRASSLVMAALLLQAPVSWAAQLDKDACTKLKSEQVQLEKDGARGSLGRGPDWAKANLGPEKIEQVRRLIEVDEQLLFRCGGRPLVVLPSDPDAAPGEGATSKPARAPGTGPETRPPVPGKKAAVPAQKPIAPPGKETVREARPAAPPPGSSAPAGGGAKEAAKETLLPAGSAPGSEAASPPAPAPAPAATAPPPAAQPAATRAEDEKKAAAPKAAKAKAKKKVEDAYRPPAPEWSSNPFADPMAPPAKK